MEPSDNHSRVKRLVALVQGGYYVALGLWPLLATASFEAVTGPNTDDWLANTVGLLISIIGFVLLYAGFRNRAGGLAAVLAVASAAGLAAIHFFYAMRGLIWPIYMLEGVGQVIILMLWTIAISRDRASIKTAASRPPTTSLKN